MNEKIPAISKISRTIEAEIDPDRNLSSAFLGLGFTCLFLLVPLGLL